MSDDAVIVSRTDAKGRIQFVNKEFVDISGFQESELITQPHNIIRHPDMPADAFADMWRDLKAGTPWSGYVKNRIKNGDHYWVQANVMPVSVGSELVGYISVRSKPSVSAVKAAEDAYRRFREGTAKGLAIEHGRVVATSGLGRARRWLQRLDNRMLVTVLGIGTSFTVIDLLGGVLGHAFTLGAIALAFAVSLKVAHDLKREMARRTAMLEQHLSGIAAGDYRRTIDVTDDELQRVNITARALQAKLAYADSEKAELERQKRAMQERLADDFEQSVRGVVATVASAVTELAHSAASMSDTARGTALRVSSATGAAQGATSNVQAVAAAAEELSSSVGEISRQIQRTGVLVSQSRERARNADGLAAALTGASDRVGKAMEMISDISGQINLLALNATIESARAGAAGRGFAVVANEVKSLAGQTDRMVDEITAVVAEMRDASSAIIGALAAIGESVESIAEAASSVASAMEEQSATTSDIARNMQDAAAGTEVISGDLVEVRASSDQAGAAAEQIRQASDELSSQAETLNRKVNDFLGRVRAAA